MSTLCFPECTIDAPFDLKLKEEEFEPGVNQCAGLFHEELADVD